MMSSLLLLAVLLVGVRPFRLPLPLPCPLPLPPLLVEPPPFSMPVCVLCGMSWGEAGGVMRACLEELNSGCREAGSTLRQSPSRMSLFHSHTLTNTLSLCLCGMQGEGATARKQIALRSPKLGCLEAGDDEASEPQGKPCLSFLAFAGLPAFLLLPLGPSTTLVTHSHT